MTESNLRGKDGAFFGIPAARQNRRNNKLLSGRKRNAALNALLPIYNILNIQICDFKPILHHFWRPETSHIQNSVFSLQPKTNPLAASLGSSDSCNATQCNYKINITVISSNGNNIIWFQLHAELLMITILITSVLVLQKDWTYFYRYAFCPPFSAPYHLSASWVISVLYLYVLSPVGSGTIVGLHSWKRRFKNC